MTDMPKLPKGIENTRSPVYSSIDSANQALSHVQEWAKWMAGIQTAALGGLGAVLLDADSGLSLSEAKTWSAIATCTFLGLALLLSAWVLSAVPSITLRLGAHRDDKTVSRDFDVYDWPSFTWPGGKLRLGILMGLQHWAWALGLVSLGVFFILEIL